MSNVNPAAVEVLTRTDMKTLLTAAEARQMGLIRMADGQRPTEEEMDLILRSSPQDFNAAADFMERNAELHMERHRKRMKVVDLVRAYARYPGETTESIVMRMTPEDRDEFFELMEAFR